MLSLNSYLGLTADFELIFVGTVIVPAPISKLKQPLNW